MKEFDKTLTQAERDAPTYMEWSDETLARCVRETAKLLRDTKGDKAIFFTVAFNMIASLMDEANAENLNTEIKGDRLGKDFKLTIKAKLTKEK